MLNLDHKRLDVWKLSLKYVKNIYTFTSSFPKSEMSGLSNQLRRASISVTSNIAEGASRKSSVERRRFYVIARSSLVEIDTQIEIALCLNYLSKEYITELENDTLQLFKMLSGLIRNT